MAYKYNRLCSYSEGGGHVGGAAGVLDGLGDVDHVVRVGVVVKVELNTGLVTKRDHRHPRLLRPDVQIVGNVGNEVEQDWEVLTLDAARGVDQKHQVHLLTALWGNRCRRERMTG